MATAQRNHDPDGKNIDPEWARQALLSRRTALLGRIETDAVPKDVAITTNVEVQEPGDAADRSVQDTDEDSLLTDAERASSAVRLIDEALLRLNDGTYGRCIDCGEAIDPRRLRSVPEAARCIDDQEIYDRDHPSGEHHATL
jgi:DnaK suppressor protein